MLTVRLAKSFSVLFLPLAVIAAYSNIFGFAFLYDDEFLIQKNRFLGSFSYLPEIFTSSTTAGAYGIDSFYRPMQISLYLIVEQIFGKAPWAFHSLNLILHIINSLLIFRLSRTLGIPSFAAFAGVLLWALHPVHVEAVTYKSATADPLHLVFMLSSILVMVTKPSPLRIAIGIFLFILALLSKESAIVFPALFMATLFLISERRWEGKTYLKSIPFWVVAGIYLILRKTVLNFNQDFVFYKQPNEYTENILFRVYTFLATIPSYLEILIWPADLHMDRKFPVFQSFLEAKVIIGAGLLSLILALFIYSVRKQNQTQKQKWLLITWGIAWLAIIHSPHTGIILPVNSLFLEHWLYAPSVTIFLGVGALIYFPLKNLAQPIFDWKWHSLANLRAFLAIFVFASLALALGVRTYQQNLIWKDPVSFFSHILKFDEGSARIRHNLAMALSDEGKVDEALNHYEFLIQASTPYAETYHNAARIHALRNDLQKAEAYFLKAIEMKPQLVMSYRDLAALYEMKNEIAKRDEFLKKYLELTGR